MRSAAISALPWRTRSAATAGRPLVERWGAYLLVGRHDLDRADRFFARWGGVAVLIARLMPVVRTFIALPAGIARMPRLRFHVYTFLGSWPWCFALAYVGYVLGERWDSDPRLRDFMHRFDAVILVGLAGASRLVRLAALAPAAAYRELKLPRPASVDAFLRARIDKDEFVGLPLTVLALLLAVSLAAFGVVLQDVVNAGCHRRPRCCAPTPCSPSTGSTR